MTEDNGKKGFDGTTLSKHPDVEEWKVRIGKAIGRWIGRRLKTLKERKEKLLYS